jgi:hypothetical protein
MTRNPRHRFCTVAVPPNPRQRRRLVELFEICETRNGSRAPDIDQPAAAHISACSGMGIGGSDDRAGVGIGRAFTGGPPASTSEQLSHSLTRTPRRPAPTPPPEVG